MRKNWIDQETELKCKTIKTDLKKKKPRWNLIKWIEPACGGMRYIIMLDFALIGFQSPTGRPSRRKIPPTR